MTDYEIRRELWLNHPHCITARYGDDGEMQCQLCEEWDYKRAPLDVLKKQVEKLQKENKQ